MNALDKVKNVRNGLNSCGSYRYLCSECPYKDRGGECEKELKKDAIAVIDALKAELKKRTSKTVEAKPGFITLTQWSSTEALQKRVVIKIDDILYISDLSNHEHCGSNIKLRSEDGFTIVVVESIEEILGKVADLKGE